jgi:hypothetical protein
MAPAWCNGVFLRGSDCVSAQMGRLFRKPELITRHDPQTTHRPEKCALAPPPAASNATPPHTPWSWS